MMKNWSLVLACLGLVACSGSSPKLAIQPLPPVEKAHDSGGEIFDPRVDILFVIDNSGSMMGHQNNLSRNVDRFVANFTKMGNLDFHIGVLSTDMEGYGSALCCGKLVGYPTYLDRNTPNLLRVLAANMKIGINGSGTEMVFEPVMSALTNPNLNGHNSGFYRPDVPLAIIFITDAEDQSRMNPDQFLTFLHNLKGRPEKVLAYGAIIPSSEPDSYDCARDEYDGPKKIEYFLSKVSNAPNNIMRLCAADFGDKLAEMGQDLKKRVANVIYLARAPVKDSIRVMFGTQEILPDHEKGWSLDLSRNAIILAEGIEWTEQPPGTKVKVTYEAARTN